MTLDLSTFPRVSLGHWPTPLDDCPRLGAALAGGPRVLVKRDDVSGLGAGGNKLRKLEFLLGAAIVDGVDTVITFGALQTNHGRQTAAACARLGLRCELILTRDVPRHGPDYELSGNMALHRLYGASVHVCANRDEARAVEARLLDETAARGGRARVFPVGGSSPLGALGYAAATVELFEQLDAARINADRIVVPVGSAGTAAGVALAVELLGRDTLVDGACVSHTAAESREDVRRLASGAAELLGAPTPSLARLHTDDRAFGPGYGVPTPEVWDALRLFARTEGITLDPVYTGKAAACLIDRVRGRELSSRETVVFLHTGGLPGVFAYADELATEVTRPG